MADPQPGDVRLRLDLTNQRYHPRWPDNYLIRTVSPHDLRAVHALLVAAFDDEPQDFETWHAARTGDSDYDAALIFIAEHITSREIHGLAWCWKSSFLKDLTVAQMARRKGLGEALFFMSMNAFVDRRTSHVDLKTNRHQNGEAYRLYQRFGMRPVNWNGTEPTEGDFAGR